MKRTLLFMAPINLVLAVVMMLVSIDLNCLMSVVRLLLLTRWVRCAKLMRLVNFIAVTVVVLFSGLLGAVSC